MDHSLVASAVFTTPEIGTVGLTEHQAIAAGHDIRVFESGFPADEGDDLGPAGAHLHEARGRREDRQDAGRPHPRPRCRRDHPGGGDRGDDGRDQGRFRPHHRAASQRGRGTRDDADGAMSERWTPDSWRGKPVLQMPEYPDLKALGDVEAQLATFPPLVFAGEARKLKKSLARVAAGEAFLLQGGDCAESFAEHGANNIRDFFRAFLQMSVVLTFAGALPVVKVGRIAGQFAKPRSSPTTRRSTASSCRAIAATSSTTSSSRRIPHARSAAPADGLSPVGGDAEPAARLRDRRLRQSRERASLDARLRQGFAAVAPYKELADRITETLNFMRACGIDLETHPGDARDGFLHQPRGAAARLRAGDDPRRFHDRRLVRHLRPHDLDRRPHAPARSCAMSNTSAASRTRSA
jgi:hypothetical protein